MRKIALIFSVLLLSVLFTSPAFAQDIGEIETEEQSVNPSQDSTTQFPNVIVNTKDSRKAPVVQPELEDEFIDAVEIGLSDFEC